MNFGSVISFKGIKPEINNNFIAPGARLIGAVKLGEGANIWYNAVLRADVGEILTGKNTNVQDNCTIHTDYNGKTVLGDFVTVGHGAIIHNSSIGNNSLIGNGAVILDYTNIGSNVIIGAGTIIPPGKKIPDNSLVMGNPFKIVRNVTEDDIKAIRENALHYAELAKEHIKELS